MFFIAKLVNSIQAHFFRAKINSRQADSSGPQLTATNMLPNKPMKSAADEDGGKMVIRAVSIAYEAYLYETPMIIESSSNVCGNAKECDIPVKNDKGETVYWRKGCCAGMVIEMFERIRKRLNFEYNCPRKER